MASILARTNVADLRKTGSKFTHASIAYTAGYYEPFDWGGAAYLWDSKSTLPDNGHTVIKHSKIATGRWRLSRTDGKYNVLQGGLKADGKTHNHERFDELLRAVPYAGAATFIFPQGTYLFGKLKDGNSGILVTDKSIALEGVPGTALAFEKAQVGIQSLEASTGTFLRVMNMSVYALGKDEMDGKVKDENGNLVWGRNHGLDYRFNGINCWSQGHFHNVSVGGFSGHGLCVWGEPTVYNDSQKVPFSGTVRYRGQGMIEMDDTPENRSIPLRPSGTCFIINGKTYQVGGVFDTLLPAVGIAPDDPIIDKHVTGYAYQKGKAQIADCGLISGICEFSGNGGDGILIVGADSNQWSIEGVCTVRGNGYWGIADQSFLGTRVSGAHGTQNGMNFNELSADGIFGNDYLVVGSFTTINSAAHSTWIACYTEKGNQGPDWYNGNARVLGGIHEAGVAASSPYKGEIPVYDPTPMLRVYQLSDLNVLHRTLETGWTIYLHGDIPKWKVVQGGNMQKSGGAYPAVKNGPTVVFRGQHPFEVGDYIETDGAAYKLTAPDGTQGFYTEPQLPVYKDYIVSYSTPEFEEI